MPEEPTEAPEDGDVDLISDSSTETAKAAKKPPPAKTKANINTNTKANTKTKAKTNAKNPRPEPEPTEPLFSPYGIASAALAAVCVASVVLVAVMVAQHRAHNAELEYRARTMQAAYDWSSTLINLNPDNAQASLQTLRGGTVGQLNADFDATVESFLQVLQQLQATTEGRVDSVAIESLYHGPAAAPGAPQAAPQQQPELTAYASRTDTVLLIATSVSQNVSGEPQTIRWNLRLDVSEVDGRFLISRLEQIQ